MGAIEEQQVEAQTVVRLGREQTVECINALRSVGADGLAGAMERQLRRFDREHGPDPRRRCKFCDEKATHVAPQHTGGDDDVPATWVPVCDSHLEDWFIDIDPDDRLPVFELSP